MESSAIQMIEQLWSDGVSQREICQEVGIPPRRFDTLRKRELSHLPARKKGFGGGKYDRKGSPPDLATIAARSAQVRARWSADELLQRTTSVRQTLVFFDPAEHGEEARAVVARNAAMVPELSAPKKVNFQVYPNWVCHDIGSNGMELINQ